MDSLASEACGSATVEESMLLCEFEDIIVLFQLCNDPIWNLNKMYILLNTFLIFFAVCSQNSVSYFNLSCSYMVDAADREKIEASRNELHNLLDKPQLQGIPVRCCLCSLAQKSF